MNTRFNPTANGRIHLGHAYLALLNEQVAHNSGGRFIVRFDDNQPDWLATLGAAQIQHYTDTVIEDLEWLQIPVDEYCYQSQMEQDKAFRTRMAIHFGAYQPQPAGMPFPDIPHNLTTDAAQYPYSPYLCAEKVVMDYLNHVDCVIRGEELMGEYGLYCHFRQRMAVVTIPHYYIGRLRDGAQELSDISKTQGNWQVAQMRADGMSPDDVRHCLRFSCLRDPYGEWTLDNIKPSPRVFHLDKVKLV